MLSTESYLYLKWENYCLNLRNQRYIYITSTCQCIANALNSECEDQIRQYKRKASIINGNENKPDKALSSEVTIPDNCKLTTENTKTNTANT